MNLLKKIWNRVYHGAVYDDKGRVMVLAPHCMYHYMGKPEPDCNVCKENTDRFYNEKLDT